MRAEDVGSRSGALACAAQRYDRDMRDVVTPSANEDVNEYVRNPVGAFLASSGKRLRPVLCEAGCLMAGGQRESARSCALALESFHVAAIIHDDIEDEARMRRGYAAYHVAEGIPLAINAGDYGLALALRLIVEDSSLSDAVKVRVLDEFTAMAQRTVEGQAMDIGWSRDGRLDVSIEECLLMIESKSACYSCAAPLAIGGIVAGATGEQVDDLRCIGLKVGLAFQIRDDLDNLQLEHPVGKDGALDILQGKRTIIVAHALEHSPEAGVLADILSSGKGDRSEIERAIGIMEECGSLAYAEDLVGRYCVDARELLDCEFAPGEGRDILEEAITMIEGPR